MPILTGPSTFRVLAASAQAASVTGTASETTLATITVPAGSMGANGILRVTTLWTITNSANSKTLRVYFGGTGGTLYHNVAFTTTATQRHQLQIHNRNSASSQIGFQAGGTVGGWGPTTTANVTSSLNTAADQDIVIRGTLANTGETITLEAYTVEILYKA